MNINSGVFIDDGNLVVFDGGDALWLSGTDCEPQPLVKGYQDIRFLTASPYGEYLSFWSITGESYRLIDLAGQEIWSCWMNTDKATPHGIIFSSLGDAVAFIFEFDGLDGMFFCDIDKRYTTTFGCSGSPIGYDSTLKYFVIDSCNPYEDGRLAFYGRDADSGSLLKIPPEVVIEKIKKGPLIVERNRCFCSSPELSIRDWDGLAVQSGVNGIEGFVILKDTNLYWLTGYTDKLEVINYNCIPHEKAYEWYRRSLTVYGDIALILSVSYGGAIVVNRNHGVVWRGSALSSVILKDQRALAQYADGTVELIRNDGSIEMKITPLSGYRLVAADITNNTLYIAYLTEPRSRVKVKEFSLN